jgi:hypothetical protein
MDLTMQGMKPCCPLSVPAFAALNLVQSLLSYPDVRKKLKTCINFRPLTG